MYSELSKSLAFLVGSVYGVVAGRPQQWKKRSMRLIVNNYVNSIGKTSSRFANSTAAAIFLYLLVGKATYYIFKEELEEYTTEIGRAALYGGLTGGLYKCIYGRYPMLLSSVLGALFSVGLTYGHQKAMFRFSIEK